MHLVGAATLHLRQSSEEKIGARLADAGLSVVFKTELIQHPSELFNDNRKFRHAEEQESPPPERQAAAPLVNSAACSESDKEAMVQYSPFSFVAHP